MISISFRYILISLSFFAAAVLGVESQTAELPVIQANQEVGASFEPSLIAYREYESGGVQGSEHGWIPGFGLKASLLHDTLGAKNLLLDVTYDFNNGSSNHHSKSLTGGPPLSYKAPFRSNDVSFGIGKGFVPNSKLLLAPRIGFEYREWHRGLPKALLSIRENYTFWAPGAGLNASYNPLHRLERPGRGRDDHC